MKTLEAIATWIVESLAHMYLHPQMYAVTQSELDCQLHLLHLIWAQVVDREADFWSYYEPISGVSSAQRPSGFFDTVTDVEPLNAVVDHYRELDLRLGLKVN